VQSNKIPTENRKLACLATTSAVLMDARVNNAADVSTFRVTALGRRIPNIEYDKRQRTITVIRKDKASASR